MILFIKHIEIEGPETMGGFFKAQGFSSKVVDLSRGDPLPALDDQIEAVISLGGPMNVDEEDKYPFFRDENAFIQDVLCREVPFLGICLGSQILAKACGAPVTKAPEKEIGFMPVHLTTQGKEDALFQGIGESINVFQWHEDTFALPEGAAYLALSEKCPHQAFRVGPCAYGIQFHIEITEKSVIEWSERYFLLPPEELKKLVDGMRADYFQRKEVFHSQAEMIYNNFLEIIKNKQH